MVQIMIFVYIVAGILAITSLAIVIITEIIKLKTAVMEERKRKEECELIIEANESLTRYDAKLMIDRFIRKVSSKEFLEDGWHGYYNEELRELAKAMALVLQNTRKEDRT